MGSLPSAAVRAYVMQPDEIPAALAHARQCKLAPSWNKETLVLRVPICGPGGGDPRPLGDITPADSVEPYLVEAIFDDYRVLPPWWRFLDPRTHEDIGIAAYPKALGPSVLHPGGLVCAHFSRMAYADHGGPHGNWGGPRSWQTRVEGTEALTASDMLARLIWEIRYNSVGRLAPLPTCELAA